MRYGCMRRNGHELVMMQEGLEHALQINAKIMVQNIAETPIFNELSVIMVKIVGYKYIRQ